MFSPVYAALVHPEFIESKQKPKALLKRINKCGALEADFFSVGRRSAPQKLLGTAGAQFGGSENSLLPF